MSAKNISGLIFFVAVLSLPSFAQIKSRALEIYSITEYRDGYVIKAIDTSTFDTLNIISPKKKIIKGVQGYERMIVGGKYNFKFEDLVSQMAAVPSGSFTIRIKTTVVWKAGDRISERPVFARNTKGLYVQKKNINEK